MVSLNTLSLGELRAHAIKTYRIGESSRPEVSLIQVGDAQAVLKDFDRSAFWFGRIFGPLLAWREARALRRLTEVNGVPRLIRQVNARALLIEHVDGISTKAIPHGGVQPELFDRLGRLVREVHEHGVAHCDLRTRGNIIVGRDGQPYLVDFAAHIERGHRWNLLWRWAQGAASAQSVDCRGAAPTRAGSHSTRCADRPWYTEPHPAGAAKIAEIR